MDSSIRSSDGSAWIRVLGSFPKKKLAIQHAKLVCAADPGLEIRVAPEGEFRVLLRSRYMDTMGSLDMKTREKETLKHAFLLERHALARSAAFSETAANAKNRQMGKLKFSPEERARAHQEEFLEALAGTVNARNSLSEENFAAEAKILEPAAFPGGVKSIGKPLELQSVAFKAEILEPESALLAAAAPGGVKSIGKPLELRMQKYAALAFIPDYEHELHTENLMNQWERKRDEEFAKIRNSALLANLKGGPLPSMRDLLEDFVKKNPPPSFINAYGQPSSIKNQESDDAVNGDTFWQRVPDVPSSSDSEVVAWMKNMAFEKEAKLWESCGAIKPDRASSLKRWFQENPIPENSSCRGAEPAVAFLKTGNSEEEIKAWIEKDCKILHEDVACVALYEWIKVSNAWNENVSKSYRESLVTKLHAKKDFQKAEASKIEGLVKEIEIFN